MTVTVVLLELQSPVVTMQERRAFDAPAQSFEVASIRPNKESPGLAPIQARPNGSVVATNVPLRGLIMFAYGLAPYDSIEGGGDLLGERFDVVARAAGPVEFARDKVGPLNIMMQNLLAERFGLVIRWEDRPREGYALVRSRADGRLGPRIRPSDLECPRTAPKPPEDARDCEMSIIDNELSAAGHRIVDLTRKLSIYLERPVVDRTALEGSFELRLRLDAKELPVALRLRPQPATVPNVAPELPSLFTALQEQLGLKLERQRVMMPVPIVERVHAPSEN